MKKFRFALLALGVAAITFAFTPAQSPSKTPAAMMYVFNASGVLIGTAPSTEILKTVLCPGSDQIFCAQIWTSKTIDNHPAGIRVADIKKTLP
ncbi:MAG: hypothetical protein KF746_18095 [Chitinophagaceae bacterium]|nr:hypothetical protein [Chitinophagaceae bacterium]